MLEPGNRTLLFDSLRPPDGYEVDFALATTYSLDLLSLLVAPLGFTFFELESAGRGIQDVDPMLLLRTVRRYADRVAIFCQAGRITVPPAQNLLYAHLEDSIVQVHAPKKDRSFHPKVWVVRFVTEGGPVRYRFLCLSRNLTFDRCWDVMVSLDGALAQRKVAYAANHPLADFIETLPTLTGKGVEVPQRILDQVAVAADELRRVDFEIPPDFESLGFRPMGIPGYSKDPITEYRADRVLAISPFLSTSTVGAIADGSKKSVLISRFEELEKLGKADLAGFSEVFVIDDSSSHTEESVGSATELNSLHAKCYVIDQGWDSSILLGSANATVSGFGGNVEFLVELSGKKSKLGVEAIMNGDSEPSLRDMLKRYEPRDEPLVDQAQKEVEELVEGARRVLSNTQWSARAEERTEARYTVTLSPADPLKGLDTSVRAAVRPLTVPAAGHPVNGKTKSVAFEEIGVESLTAFYAFHLEASKGPAKCETEFVLRADLTGVPADRKEQLLRYHLRDPQQVMRFLLLLLAWDRDGEGVDFDSTGMYGLGSGRWQTGESEALLEPMLRALAENPRALDQVAETIGELRRGENAVVLPPGLERIWDAIWEARSGLAEAAKP
jgi:hypothetical protein